MRCWHCAVPNNGSELTLVSRTFVHGSSPLPLPHLKNSTSLIRRQCCCPHGATPASASPSCQKDNSPEPLCDQRVFRWIGVTSLAALRPGKFDQTRERRARCDYPSQATGPEDRLKLRTEWKREHKNDQRGHRKRCHAVPRKSNSKPVQCRRPIKRPEFL